MSAIWQGGVKRAGINDLYKTYFGRDADAAGLQHWQSQYDSGAKSYDQIRSALVASDEYKNRAAKSTKPFIYGDHDNSDATAPTLINNPNSSIKFEHNVGGQSGLTKVFGDGFKAFNVGGPNNPTGGGSGGAGAGGGMGGVPDKHQGFFDLLKRQNDAYQQNMKNMFGQMNERTNSLFGQFNNLAAGVRSSRQGSQGGVFGGAGNRQRQDAASNWNNPYNSSPVFRPNQRSQGPRSNAFGSWGRSNPFKVQTF